MKVLKRVFIFVLVLALAAGCMPMAMAANNSCDAVISASSLNLRSGAGASYSVLATAPRGATLTVIGISTENSDWFKVNYNGIVGYMDSTYVINANSSAAAEAIATAAQEAANAQNAAVSTPSPTATPAATQTPAASTPDANDPTWLVLTPSGSSNATVTGELVRFRSTPGGEILGNFSNGARVNVTATSGSWYEINCNGTVGYVHSNYISLDSASSSSSSTAAATPPAATTTTPASTPVPTVSAPVNTGAGQQIVNTAMQYQGVPYLWGGTSPSGFDCSGLVYYVYQQCGYSINRVAHSIYTGGGSNISRENLAVGDIICFGNSSYVWHVGIYVGNGQFIHAPYSGAVVRVESISGTYATNFVCGKRIV